MRILKKKKVPYLSSSNTRLPATYNNYCRELGRALGRALVGDWSGTGRALRTIRETKKGGGRRVALVYWGPPWRLFLSSDGWQELLGKVAGRLLARACCVGGVCQRLGVFTRGTKVARGPYMEEKIKAK